MQQDFEQIKDKIYPIIKSLSTEDKLKNTIKLDQNREPIHENLIGDLFVFFGIDHNTYFELLNPNHLPDDGIEFGDLYNLSVKNLDKKIGNEIELVETNFGARMLLIDGGSEASAITLGYIWNFIQNEIAPHIAFAVPSKDVVFFADFNDKTTLNNMRNEISALFKDGKDLISNKIFSYVDGEYGILNI